MSVLQCSTVDWLQQHSLPRPKPFFEVFCLAAFCLLPLNSVATVPLSLLLFCRQSRPMSKVLPGRTDSSCNKLWIVCRR